MHPAPCIPLPPQEKTIIAACNSAEVLIKQGKNANARIFHLRGAELQLHSAFPTSTSLDPFHHQKAATFNDRGHLGVGTTDGTFTVYRRKEVLAGPLDMGGEVLDVAAHKGLWCVTTRERLTLYDSSLTKVTSLDAGTAGSSGPCEFRAARCVCPGTAGG
jgi:hypothetical protein